MCYGRNELEMVRGRSLSPQLLQTPQNCGTIRALRTHLEMQIEASTMKDSEKEAWEERKNRMLPNSDGTAFQQSLLLASKGFITSSTAERREGRNMIIQVPKATSKICPIHTCALGPQAASSASFRTKGLFKERKGAERKLLQMQLMVFFMLSIYVIMLWIDYRYNYIK